ncbi:MAG: 1-acyl-sn-glycerol-3-phosphate acyltransferase [Anaerolineales bacterium]
MTNTETIALADSLVNELARAMSLPQTPPVKGILRALFGRAIDHAARLFLDVDRQAAEHGSAAAARWLLPRFVAGYTIHGAEIIPPSGPLIIAANHPAAYDAMVITASVERPDFKIIIGQVPPYHYLPNVSRHAIFSPHPKDTFGRMQTVRDAIQHLRAGGALLIFPRGGIEPDPDFMPHPDADFHRWSRSLEIFLRRVPAARILVTAVSGVISPRAMRHPITWFRRARPDRQRLAFMYQIICQAASGRECFGLRPRVTFGELLSSADPHHLLAEVEQSARRTLARHMAAAW